MRLGLLPHRPRPVSLLCGVTQVRETPPAWGGQQGQLGPQPLQQGPGPCLGPHRERVGSPQGRFPASALTLALPLTAQAQMKREQPGGGPPRPEGCEARCEQKPGGSRPETPRPFPGDPLPSQLSLHHPPCHEHPSASHSRPFHDISTTSAVLVVLVKCFLNCQVPVKKCSRQLYPRMVASGWVSRQKWTETHGALGIMFLSTVL